MRTIRVKNASILAIIEGVNIDFEVRDNKATKGISLFVYGKKLIDIEILEGGKLKDGDYYTDEKAPFRIEGLNLK